MRGMGEAWERGKSGGARVGREHAGKQEGPRWSVMVGLTFIPNVIRLSVLGGSPA